MLFVGAPRDRRQQPGPASLRRPRRPACGACSAHPRLPAPSRATFWEHQTCFAIVLVTFNECGGILRVVEEPYPNPEGVVNWQLRLRFAGVLTDVRVWPRQDTRSPAPGHPRRAIQPSKASQPIDLGHTEINVISLELYSPAPWSRRWGTRHHGCPGRPSHRRWCLCLPCWRGSARDGRDSLKTHTKGACIWELELEVLKPRKSSDPEC